MPEDEDRPLLPDDGPDEEPAATRVAVPERFRPWVRIGTCSWKYDSWKGLVYRHGKRYRAHDYLPDYARHYDTVEIDQWFWSLFPGTVRLPDPRTVEAYARSVPPGFTFTVKAPNALTLTHFYARQPPRYADHANRPNEAFLDPTLLEHFLERLSPMDKRLGPIMFQFEYLNKRKMPSLEAFLERFGRFLDAAPKGYQYAVETRNPNYLSEAFFDFLAERKLGFVYLEGYYMPPIGEVFERYRPATADFGVIRLHGPDREGITKRTGDVWDTIVAPQPDALVAAARIAEFHRARSIQTFVNVNNHFEGSAPLSIDRFVEQLRLIDG